MAKACSILSLLLIPLFLVSCASERKVTYEKVDSGIGTEMQYVQDDEGNWVPDKGSDKRSSYEGSRFSGTQGYQGAKYSTDRFRKQRWSGDQKEYGTKAFAGNEGNASFYQKPYFVQQVNEQGKSAYLGDKYSTGAYSGAAQIAESGTEIRRPVDAKVSTQKAKSPSKVHEYYKKDGDYVMGLDDTRRLMGR